MDLSIIIPTFNEASNVKKLVKRITAILKDNLVAMKYYSLMTAKIIPPNP